MRRRLHPLIAAGLLGVLALCWVLLTPPGAGADEPSHFYRAGKLAEGDFSELLAREDFGRVTTHWLPSEYATPEPGCYAWSPEIPVDCAVGTEAQPGPDGRVLVGTSASEYPIWGHLVPAVGPLLPGDGGIWAARVAGAAVCVALLAAATWRAASERRWGVAGVAVACTPMVWSTITMVNPSAFATAGAVALWVALLTAESWTRSAGWLAAAGWAAVSLPRRDGLTWACLTVAIALLFSERDLLADLWRSRRQLAWPLVVIALTTALALTWAVTNVSRVAQLGALAPLAVAAAWVARWGWERIGRRPAARSAYVAGGLLAIGAAVAVAMVERPGGWDADLTRAVVEETRRHLTEAIGVLGWLDAPLPRWAAAGWVVLVAALVAVAVRDRAWRGLLLAGATLATAIVTAWVFELQSGNPSGRYWQGRYSLPLLVGVPLALTLTRPASNPAAGQLHETRTIPATTSRAVVAGVVVGALFLVNVAAWAAVRRWAVGIHGTHRPWKWGAELFAVHPLPVLVVHALASAALAWMLYAQRFVPPSSK